VQDTKVGTSFTSEMHDGPIGNSHSQPPVYFFSPLFSSNVPGLSMPGLKGLKPEARSRGGSQSLCSNNNSTHHRFSRGRSKPKDSEMKIYIGASLLTSCSAGKGPSMWSSCFWLV
jgi:hypothetical protein